MTENSPEYELPGKETGSLWRNRIVGYGEEAPDQLMASPWNWRGHGKNQQNALAGTLDEIGWLQNILVNRTTNHIVDGHLRVLLAMRHNEEKVPVTYVELTEAEEKLALATLDPISAMAFSDTEALDALLREVETSNAAVQEMLAGVASEAGLYTPDMLDYSAGEDDRGNSRLAPGKSHMVVSIGTLAALVPYECAATLMRAIGERFGDDAGGAVLGFCEWASEGLSVS